VSLQTVAPATTARGTPPARVLSGAELLLGAVLVIGHNVFEVLPNEVPILVLLGLVSVRVRNGGWAAIGLQCPDSWPRIVVIAVAAAAVRLLVAEYAIEPLTSRFWPEPLAPEGFNDIAGSPLNALIALGLVWTFAAFGEEFGYRGYLLNRAADAFGGTRCAWWTGVLIVAVLFGYGHYYKGPAGIVDSGFAGLVLGAAYLLARRNLFAPMLAHGFIDTVGVVALFFGWDS
jgi:CAAX protease family protein